MHICATIRAATLGLGLAAALGGAATAGEYDLSIDRVVIETGEFKRSGIGFNGSSPGPLLRFKEGEDVTIRVKNSLDEPSSIHWHGMILAYQQDGVPGLSFEGIAPGATHTYRFPISQTGTYWYHSHSGFQEPDGAYGAIIIEPKDREPFRYDRDYVVQFTDAHRHQGSRIFRNLKTMPDYYNRQQRTLVDLVRDAREDGLGAALSDRFMWGSMRMMPTDIEDVPGTTPLINGEGPEENWTGLFNPGERVRLRFINSSAMTYFDVRIPGLEMTVVQADGQNVQPVKVDELRIAVAETYDVIVRPTEDRAYTMFAETMGRSAYARGTLAPRPGMEAEVPEMRERNLLTMADMGMDHGAMGGMDHGAMGGGHVMPDGTVMQGGMDNAAMGGGHTMPDGTVMQGMGGGMDHGGMAGTDAVPGGTARQTASDAGTSFGATDSWTHTMPGGATMQGPAHGGMDHGSTGGGSHTMPDGSMMQGPAHGGMDHGSTGGGAHTMPDGSIMQGPAHGGNSGGLRKMPGSTSMHRPARRGMEHGFLGRTIAEGVVVQASWHGGVDQQPASGWTHTMPDGSTMQGPAHGGGVADGAASGTHTMPDGTVMQGGSHGGMDHGAMGGSAHTMPDGTVMQGGSHGGMDHGAQGGSAHTMPDGSVMQGGSHSGMDHGAMGGGTHTMPDGTMMQGGAHGGMDHGAMGGGAHTMPDGTMMQGGAHGGMDHGAMGGGAHTMPDGTMMQGGAHGGMDHGAMGHGSSAGGEPFYAPGSGLIPAAANGGRFLSYADLKAMKPLYPDREPTREIELRLTGNMERYIWSMNGVKFEDAEPIRLRYGERVRFKLVNETMMSHPMHLHGMWSILDNGNGQFNPAKHVVSVAPGTTVTMETEVDAEGVWAFHCHLAYHMDAGMMRKVIVEGGPLGFKESDAAGFGPVHNVITDPDYVTGTGS